MKEMIDVDDKETQLIHVPKLRFIYLEGMAKLKSIARNGMLECKSVESVEILDCPELRSLAIHLPVDEKGVPLCTFIQWVSHSFI